MNEIKDEDILKFMGKLESPHIVKPSYFLNELLEQKPPRESGDLLPWEGKEDLIQFRDGEVTLWGGYSGHGKSLVLSQVILTWLQHTKIALASLEMKPARLIERMISQTGQCNVPSDDYIRAFVRWSDDRLWIYDQQDQVPHDRIIAMVRYCAVELGCKHIIIDSLMKCGIDDDDYNKQKEFIDHICWAAKTNSCHIHVVVHMRKPDKGGEEQVPGKYSVLGSSAITNLVDQIVVFWRNKKYEETDRSNLTSEELQKLGCGALLKVVKNRHGGKEGAIGLFFNDDHQQYNRASEDRRVYLNLPMDKQNGGTSSDC